MRKSCCCLIMWCTLMGAPSVHAVGPLEIDGGAIFLTRSTSESMNVIIDGGAADVFDASDYTFDFQAGFQCGADLELCDQLSLIGEFFQVRWDERFSGTGAGIWADTDPDVGDAVATDVFTTFDSELLSALLGFERQFNEWLSFYGCFRHISLDDALFAEFTHGAISDGVYRDTVDNDLNGICWGLTATLLEDERKRLLLKTGFGVYENDVDHGSYYTGGIPTVWYAEESDTTSWSFELDLDYSCQVTGYLRIGAGYRLLFIDDVALSTNQTPYTNYVALRGTNDSSDVLFHGLRLFAEITL